MSLKVDSKAGFPAAALPVFDNSRQRTTSSTSSVLSSSSSSSLFAAFPFASFYFGHLRRRPAFLLSVLVLSLLLIAISEKYSQTSLSSLYRGFFHPHHEDSLGSNISSPPEPKPLTELGFEADYVYENIGSTDVNEYRVDLEDFLKARFPSEDAKEDKKDSLMAILHAFVPPPPRQSFVHPQKAFQQIAFMPWKWTYNLLVHLWTGPPPNSTSTGYPTIPKNIFQTGPFAGSDPPPEKLLPQTWKNLNQNYNYTYFDNDAASKYIHTRFNESLVNDGKGGGIARIYNDMKDVPVMQSDFWRYAILATEGGVYSDFDTKCLKSIEGWHRPPWLRMLSIFEDEPRRDPAIIVGIEVDVGSRPDWHAWWPRPLGIVQWTMASTKGHPILIDTMRRVVEAIDQTNSSALSVEGQHRTLDAIVEMTGPAPFTDSVLRYLGAKYNVTWPDLRHLPAEGKLFGDENMPADVLVLSVTAFSPGVGQFGSGDVKSEAALVQHFFAGSWKHD